jgi:cytochrome b pre-mRNA-processing protein 3
MILGLFRRGREATASALYATIVARSRQPVFYTDYGVPDTVDGRFDMIVLHLALLCRRLTREPEAARGAPGARGVQVLGQGVFDMFCRDMDHNLREMGVGDLAVPRKMQGFGEAFYGRVEVYDRALSAPDGCDLAAAVARNIFGQNEIPEGAGRLAAYMRLAAEGLDRQSADDFNRGLVTYPDPDTVAA